MTELQLQLFPPTTKPWKSNSAVKLARHTDKQTSHDAAKGVNLGLSQQRCLDVLTGEMTASEVAVEAWAKWSDKSMETYRKRVHELVGLGLAEELPARRCSVTGKMATGFRRKVTQ